MAGSAAILPCQHKRISFIPIGMGKVWHTICNPMTPRATPATVGNRAKQHIQLTENKKYEQDLVQHREIMLLVGQKARIINRKAESWNRKADRDNAICH